MTTIMDKQHKWLIKRYHTLCTQMGMEAHEKAAILQAYNADSSLDLSVQDLQDICSKLEYMLQPDLEKMDLWRKRVMAAIGGWMRVINKDSSSAMIKGIACRASGYEKFNEIPRERLINLYHAFTKKQKDFQAVHEITSEEIEILAYCN